MLKPAAGSFGEEVHRIHRAEEIQQHMARRPGYWLLQRYDAAFTTPLYGIVGGLHFPVPEGRIKIGPLDAQRRFASGSGMFDPISMEEVEREIALLKERRLGLIAVSAHDSSDEVIDLVRREFGEAHRHLRVGEEIVIRAPQ